MFSRFLRLSTLILVTWTWVTCGGWDNPIAAQSRIRNNQRDFIPNSPPTQIRRPSRFQRSYAPSTNTGGVASPTSPRMQQLQTLNDSKLERTRPSRRPGPIYGGSGSNQLPTTGLNPSTNTSVVDSHLRRSPSRISRSKKRPTALVIPYLEDVVFESEDSKLPMRQWVDNTGTFATVGRMIEIRGQLIRLMKENGRTTTVPVRRLSVADIDYVSKQVKPQTDGRS